MPSAFFLQAAALWLLLLAALLVDDGAPPQPSIEPERAGGACPFCGIPYEAADLGRPCACWEGWGWF